MQEPRRAAPRRATWCCAVWVTSGVHSVLLTEPDCYWAYWSGMDSCLPGCCSPRQGAHRSRARLRAATSQLTSAGLVSLLETTRFGED